LDENKLTMLRRWGEGLARDEREEVRAAGRAIVLLSDEVERLHVDLWHAHDRSGPEETESPPAEGPEWPHTGIPDVGSTLRERIAAFRLRKDA
jgi:hypothetical protein